MNALYYCLALCIVCLSLPLLSELVAVVHTEPKPWTTDSINIAVIGASLSSLAHLHYLVSSLPAAIRTRLAITIFEASESFVSCASDAPIHALSTDHLLHALLSELDLSNSHGPKSESDNMARKDDSIGIWSGNASMSNGKDWIMRFSAHFRESPVGLASFLTQLVRQYGFSSTLRLYQHMKAIHSQLSNAEAPHLPYTSLDELVRRLNLTIPYEALSITDLFAMDPVFVEQFIEPLLRQHSPASNTMNALCGLALLSRDIFMKPGMSFATLPSRVPLMAALLASLKRQAAQVNILFNSPVEKVTSIWTWSMEPKSRFQIHIKGHAPASQDSVLYEKLILATPIASLPPFYYSRVREMPSDSDIGGEYDPEWRVYKSKFRYEQVHCIKVTSPTGLDPSFFQHDHTPSNFDATEWSWQGALSLLSKQLHSETTPHAAPTLPSTVLANRNEHELLTIFKRDAQTYEISAMSPLSEPLLLSLFRENDFKIIRRASFLAPCCRCLSSFAKRFETATADGPGEEPVPTDHFPSLNPAKDAYLLSAMDALCPTQNHIELLLMQAKNMALLIQQRLLQEQADSM